MQPSDSLYKNCPFAAVAVNPSLSSKNDAGSGNNLDFRADITKFSGGPFETSLEGGFFRIRESPRHTASYGLGAAYYSLAAEYDPTVPQRYLEYAFHFSDKRERKNPLTISYDLSLLQEAGGERLDLKNALKLKLQRKLGHRVSAFIKPGCILDISNSTAGGFLQPLFSGGIMLTPDPADMILIQLYAAYPLYSNAAFFVVGRKGRKPLNAASTISQPRVPVSLLFLSYCRELNPSLNVNINYDFTMLDRGGPGSIYSSNRISCSLEYNRTK